MKTYTLQDLTIKESDIKQAKYCECGARLRLRIEKETQLCEECAVDMF